MITRISSVKVPASLHAEFEAKFLSVSVPYVLAAPGIMSVSVGRPTKWVPDEDVMISVWASEKELQGFTRESWNRAVIPSGVEKYISECWVHHYEIFG